MRTPTREKIMDGILISALGLGVCFLLLMVLAFATALGETWGFWELGMVS